MTTEELKEKLAAAFPGQLGGVVRPDEPIESDHDFFTDLPQLISKDPVIYDKMNLILSVLLSNDKQLHENAQTLENEREKYLPLSGGTMTGLLSLFTGSTVPTPDADDNSTKIVNSEWVQSFIQNFADVLSDKLEVEWNNSTFTVSALGITGLMDNNGYICFGNRLGGLIIQWAKPVSQGKNSYPLTFPNKCVCVLATNRDSQGSYVDNAFGYVVSAETYYYATKPSDSSTVNFYSGTILAIGY